MAALSLVVSNAVNPEQAVAAGRSEGVYEVKMVERGGPGLKHWLMLYTIGVRPQDDGVVFVSDGTIGNSPPPSQARDTQRLPEAKPIRPNVWKLTRRESPRAQRLISKASRRISKGRTAYIEGFGGSRDEPISPQFFQLTDFNRRTPHE